MHAPPLESPEAPKSRRVAILRFVAWIAILVALAAGILLYLRYARGITPLL
ncbi:MAG TPA: hypothetical protein VJU87_03185 [Gemmatimonadaceae bacterium]|nr:hypothetical protein [Gemmatimonadaceae bacterium]